MTTRSALRLVWLVVAATFASCDVHVADSAAVSVQGLTLPTTTLVPIVADATLDSAAPNQGTGNAGGLPISTTRRLVVNTNWTALAAAVAPGDHVLSARLLLPWARVGGSGGTFEAHALTRGWTEYVAAGSGQGATWNCAEDTALGNGVSDCSTNPWTTPGGDFDPAIAGATTFASTSKEGTLEIDITSDVRARVADPLMSRHGYVVVVTSGSTDLYARETAHPWNQPSIEIVTAPSAYVPEDQMPPPIDRSTPTHLYEHMAYLLEPARGLQWETTPGTIEPERAAVVRGSVRSLATGAYLEGVDVRVAGVGTTRTRTNADEGHFELMVNGGGAVLVEFSASGYLPAQRWVDVGWNDWTVMEEVALMPLSARPCVSASAGSLAIGPTSGVDGRGARTLRMYVPAGATASGTLANGTTVSGGAITQLCLGEYTDAPSTFSTREREAGMPQGLPPGTSFTYAFEGAIGVAGGELRGGTFSQPAYVWLDNFLHFDVGTIIPNGSLSYEQDGWVGQTDGLVMEVARDGAGACTFESSGRYWTSALDLSTDERNDVCATIPLGSTREFWRVPISHFSPADLNLLAFLVHLPAMLLINEGTNPGCNQPSSGSIIQCESRILGEEIPVLGTNFSLMYSSDRHFGREEAFEITFDPYSGSPEPTLQGAYVELHVAGQTIPLDTADAHGYVPVSGFLDEMSISWDGRDRHGMQLQGPQRGYLRIGYLYDARYAPPRAPCPCPLEAVELFSDDFAQAADATREATGDPAQVIVWRTQAVDLGTYDDSVTGLGGWHVSAQHVYDPATGTLYLGEGGIRPVREIPVATRIVGTDLAAGTGQLDVAVLPGGDALTIGGNGALRRVDRRTQTTYPITVTGASLGVTTAVAAGPRGTVWVTSSSPARLFELTRTTYNTYNAVVRAGGGTQVPTAGEPVLNTGALDANGCVDVAAGNDGEVYMACGGLLMQWRADGTSDGRVSLLADVRNIDLIAGGSGFSMRAVTVAPDGSVYYATMNGFGDAESIYMVGRAGGSVFVAGTNGTGPVSVAEGATGAATRFQGIRGLAVDREGAVFVAMEYPGSPTRSSVRRISEGLVHTVIGWEPSPASTQPEWPPATTMGEVPAHRMQVAAIGDVAWVPDGTLLVTDAGVTYPGASSAGILRTVGVAYDRDLNQVHRIASEDGSVTFEFTAGGRHYRTVDALTGRELLRFEYDDEGRLFEVWDRGQRALSATYSSSAPQVVLEGPGATGTSSGSRARMEMTLTDDYATAVRSLAGTGAATGDTTWTLDYYLAGVSRGLLTGLYDALGNRHAFDYDGGYLLLDEAPADTGGWPAGQILTRSTTGTGTTTTLTSPEGHTDTFETSWSRLDRAWTRTHTGWGGETQEMMLSPDGSEPSTATSSWGTTLTTYMQPDPGAGVDAFFADETRATRTWATGSDEIRVFMGRTRTTSPVVWRDQFSFVSSTGPWFYTETDTNSLISGASYRQRVGTPNGSELIRATTYLDSLGRVIRVDLPGTHPTCVAYEDNSDRVLRVTRGPLAVGSDACATTGTRRETTYNRESARHFLISATSVSSSTTPSVTTTFTGRDRRGWASSWSIPGSTAGSTRTFTTTRDVLGQTTSLTLPSAAVHSFGTTARGSEESYTSPASTSVEVGAATYTPDGMLSTAPVRGGRSVSATYDSASGALDVVTADEGGGTIRTYDWDFTEGRSTRVIAASGATSQTLQFGYEGTLLANQTWSGSYGVSGGFARDLYGYTSSNPAWAVPARAGLVSQEAATVGSNTGTLSYGYDTSRRLNQITFAQGAFSRVASLSRFASATGITGTFTLPPVSGSFSSGIVTTEHDLFGDLYTITSTVASTNRLRVRVVERDGLGRIACRQEESGVAWGTITSYRYAYDAAGRLTGSRTCSGVCSACAAPAATWSYNAAGTRSDYLADSDDRITQRSSGATDVRTYNAVGQLLTRDLTGGTTTDQEQFDYDVLGRLRSYRPTPAGTLTNYEYDGIGRLIVVRQGTTVLQRFIYRDREEPVAWQQRNTACGGTDPMDTSYFVYGTMGHVPDLQFVDSCSNGTIDRTRRIVTDERGSVRFVDDLAVTGGGLVQTVQYDVWGDPGNTWLAGTGVQPFGFAGGIWLEGPRVWHFGVRDYDPRTGRWTTKDPIGFAGGTNNYVYCENDPINCIDTTGLCGIDLAFDLFFISVDLWNIFHECGDQISNFLSLGMDLAGAFIPCAFGLGHLDDLGRLFRGADNLGNPCHTGMCGLPGGGCFVEGTPVQTEDGLVPIESLTPGDAVYSLDEATGEWGYHTVLDVTTREDQAVLSIELAYGDESGGLDYLDPASVDAIQATGEHPFFTRDGWLQARRLEIGTEVFTSAGEWATVVATTWAPEHQTVHNLVVEGSHTYFVGEAGVWVHNSYPSLDDLSRAAGQMDRGGELTRAGRSLQKHGDRAGSVYPVPVGNPNHLNAVGQDIVDDILTTPGSTFTRGWSGRFGDVINVRAPDGRGLQFRFSDRYFIGFREP